MKCKVENAEASPGVYPCVMVGSATGANRLYFSEDCNIHEDGYAGTMKVLMAEDYRHSTPAPAGTKFIITLVAGEGDCLIREWRGSSSGKIVKYLCTPCAVVQVTDGNGKAPHVERHPDCACSYPTLPKGTVSAITFIQQPNGPCKVEYKEEEPKDWLPVTSGSGPGTDIYRGYEGVVHARWRGIVLPFHPSEFQFMADTFQRLADEHKAKDNA